MQAANSQFRGDSSTFVRRAIIRIVLEDLLREESGAMALQHLGILWIIYEYSDDQNPITTARLTALTRVTSSKIIELTSRLERLGLIDRKRVPASHGKGRTWEYRASMPRDLVGKAVQGLLSGNPAFQVPEDFLNAIPVEPAEPATNPVADAPVRRKKRGPKPGSRRKRPTPTTTPE